jgi:hypothetical protein
MYRKKHKKIEIKTDKKRLEDWKRN